jgi:hypothetical protein
MSGAWLRKKVRHPWLGGPRRLPNGALLRAGLVDELNLILCPAVDGAKRGAERFRLSGSGDRPARACDGDGVGEQSRFGGRGDASTLPDPERGCWRRGSIA